ncbi:MAG TPA: glycosyl hydrolase [Solirubrobacterales bacterium]|jgi:hypothetical protein
MRRARTLALVAILVAFATQGAAPALAKGGFYGVHDASRSLPYRDVKRMDQGGVGTVRRLVYWAGVEPRRGHFNWAGFDRAVGKLASKGIAMLPVIYGSPRYIARTPNVPPTHGPKKRKIWRKFLAQAVKRYGTGGVYWTAPGLYHRQHPGKPALPIRDWQIWNEPNLKKFFAPHPSVPQYAALVRNAHRAIASTDRRANVVLAGMSGRGHPSDKKYLNRFYAAHRIQASFEAVAINPYAPKVSQVGRKIRRIRGVMKRHGDKRTPVWITELGWGSHRPDRFGLNKGTKGQKRMLQKSFRLIRHHRRAWHVKRLIWFDFRDPPASRGGCSFCTSAGLLKHGGKPKPAWRAFKRFSH